MGGQAGSEAPVGSPAYSAERLAILRRLETSGHFWFVGRTALLRQILANCPGDPGSTWVEIGCGTGHALGMLAGDGRRVVGIDRLRESLRLSERQAPGASLARADATRIPLRDGCCEGVLMLDVLEHVDDDSALREARRILRPGGVLVLTVPACESLWSSRDEEAGHLRRYSHRTLTARLREGGFELREYRYYQSLLFPAFVLSRLLDRRRAGQLRREEQPPGWLNRLLRAVNLFEVRLGRWVRLPWGSSLVAVAVRPDGT